MKALRNPIAVVLCLLTAVSPAFSFAPDLARPAPVRIFSLPSRLGRITQSHFPSSSGERPDFILIQNIHCNRSVQQSISGILGALDRQGILPRRIGAEGMSGPFDVRSLRDRFPLSARARASDYLVSQGEMPGELHYLLTGGQGELYGIEAPELYDTALELFRRSYHSRSEMEQRLDRVGDALRALSSDPRTARNASLVRQDIGIAGDMLRLELTPDRLPSALRAIPYSLERLKAVLPSRLSNQLHIPISASIDFYALALLRDEAFYQNALKLRATDRQTTTVLVTGGFHTPGLTALLKRGGFSYAVITPAVRELNAIDHRLYIERMLDHHLTVEQARFGTERSASLIQPRLARIFPSLFSSAAAGDPPALRPPSKINPSKNSWDRHLPFIRKFAFLTFSMATLQSCVNLRLWDVGNPMSYVHFFLPAQYEALFIIGTMFVVGHLEFRDYYIRPGNTASRRFLSNLMRRQFRVGLVLAIPYLSYLLFHCALNCGQVSVNINHILLRTVSVWLGITVVEYRNFRKGVSPSMNWRTPLRWAISVGVVSGYYVYCIYSPAVARIPHWFTQTNFALTWGMLSVDLCMLFVAAAMGEKKDLVIEWKEALRVQLKLLPYEFIIWYPATLGMWWVENKSKSLLAYLLLYSTMMAFWTGFFKDRFDAYLLKGKAVQAHPGPSATGTTDGKGDDFQSSPLTRLLPRWLSLPVDLALWPARAWQEWGHAKAIQRSGARPRVHLWTLHPSTESRGPMNTDGMLRSAWRGVWRNWKTAALLGIVWPFVIDVPALSILVPFLCLTNALEALLSSVPYRTRMNGISYDSDMQRIIDALRVKLDNPSLFSGLRSVPASLWRVWDGWMKPDVRRQVEDMRARMMIAAAA